MVGGKVEKYKYLIVPFTTLIICQFLKFIGESIKCRKLKWGRLLNGTGGMPSSHTSFTFSLVFLLAFTEGITSSLFAIALICSIIVAYDAMGLRMESGKQAEAINILLDEVFEEKYGFKHLKESLGHRPLEVLAGIVLAFLSAYIFHSFIF